MSCGVCFSDALLAGDAWAFHVGSSDCFRYVFADGSDDLSVSPSDYVCKLYAVSVSGAHWRGPVLEKRKAGALYGGRIFDDYDKLLFFHRRAFGAVFLCRRKKRKGWE